MPAPEPIRAILEAPSTPLVIAGPERQTLALLQRPGLPSIAELSRPDLRLAGLAIDPANDGPSGTSSFSGIAFQHVSGGPAREVELPPGARLIAPAWSPDGRRLAFLLLRDDEVELWAADAATGDARRLTGRVSAIFLTALEWLPDSSGLLVRLVPEGRGEPPRPIRIPAGPVVRQSEGENAPRQTLLHLLSGPHDEALFEHHSTSVLAIVDLNGRLTPLGSPAMVSRASISPDGRYILQHRLKRPFSYSSPFPSFPTEILVTDRAGTVLRLLADLPSGDSTPGAPRLLGWRDDAPATLVWAEPAGGTGNVPAPRERLVALDAPFSGPARLLVTSEHRLSGIRWGRADLALLTAVATREQRSYLVAIDPRAAGGGRILHSRPFRGPDRLGRPVLRPNAAGRELLHFTPAGDAIYFESDDSLSHVDVATGEATLLWRSAPGEMLFGLADPAADRLLTWRESAAEPPNLFLAERSGDAARRITSFADPAPELAGIRQRRLTYRRADGAPLSGTLHLPPGHDPQRDGRLPVLVWAYPVTMAEPAALPPPATQDERFVRPTGFDDLPLLLLTQGYAVFRAAMPIVGGEGRPPNDTHIEQLVANAEAAVEALIAEGIADRDRIAVYGWSYGAAMAANLLAHTDLFRTGIAVSGAYNRTLTPFGFQASERRTLWEAPETYLRVSPFLHADRVNEPILLFHGEADANSGTYPMQSERFYTALQANGATARLILFPSEQHSFRARESLNHMMWEITAWLDRYLRAGE